jgi:tRNA(Ile)-lysidine synthase
MHQRRSDVSSDMQSDALIDRAELAREFPPDRTYLVAVSGGRDSVALLHNLLQLGYSNLVVSHLNHRLRGRASDADAAFVRALSRKWGVRFAGGKCDVRGRARQTKMSLEAAGREARYNFFSRLARRHQCRDVFVAHHADDLVETFCFRLFRGAGPAGLVGMRKVSTRKTATAHLTIVRPLLSVWGEQIDAYVKRHRLKFREDSSNADPAPLRNRIRLRILPYLEKAVGRDIRRNLWRTAMILAEEEPAADAFASLGQNGGEIAIPVLQALSLAVQRRVLYRWLRAADVGDVGFDVIERIRRLIDPANGRARTNVSGNRHVCRRAGKLFIEQAAME